MPSFFSEVASVLDKTKKYLLGVSGGPDSMALLDMAFNKTSNIVVVHINYHKRESAKRDENIVRDYCDKNNIKLYVFNYLKKEKGNFQENARNYRYEKFASIAKKEQCDEVLIAHNQDDYIETYLFKLERGNDYDSVALKQRSIVKGVSIYRPLINKSKASLEEYCKKHKICYGIDESNNSDIYTRNRIRKDVAKLSLKQREKLLKKIEKAEEKKEIENKKTEEFYNIVINKANLNKENLAKVPSKYRHQILYRYLVKNSKIYPAKLSGKRLDDLIEKILSNKDKKQIIISNEEILLKKGDFYSVVKKEITHNFSYVIEKIKPQEFKEFKIALYGQVMQGIHIDKDELPLTIRNYRPSDEVLVNEGHKKVARIFIDKKIPLVERNKIPLLVTSKNQIVLICGIYQDMAHKLLQSNIFVVKL